MNELRYSQGFQGLSFPQMDHLSDHQTSSHWEGQQNFHSHSGENGTIDSFESVPISRNSHGGTVSGMDAQSLPLDSSWATQDTTMDTLGWLLQSSSPPASVRTVTSERPVKAQSVELRQSLSQISHHSDMTDRSLSLPDTGLYPTFSSDNMYSESKFIDEIDSSHGSYHNGDAKVSSRRQSYMVPMITASSYQAFTSPEEVMLTSPLDLMSQTMFEPSATHNGISSAMDPLDMNDSNWPHWDTDGSEDSTPYSSDTTWTSNTAPKNPMNYSPHHTTNSTRASRKAVTQQNSRVNGDYPANFLTGFDGLPRSDQSHSQGSVEIDSPPPRDHPLYQKATIGPDGLYHCPWEGKDLTCSHKPEKLKCNYDKFVDSHLKPYRCKVHACENARFSSTACLLRHEREAHAMHGHGEKPFLCTFDGCERGIPGNGFPRHWNLCDHMKRVHNRSPSPTPATKPARSSKKRKSSTGELGSSKKSPGTALASVEKIRAPVRSLSLSEQIHHDKQQLMSAVTDISDLDDFEAVEAAQAKIEKAAQNLTRALQQMKPGQKMERTNSQQSG